MQKYAKCPFGLLERVIKQLEAQPAIKTKADAKTLQV